MKTIQINGSVRNDFGKKNAKALRKSNNVPCVMYGLKKDENGNEIALHFTVSNDELRKIIYTPHIYVVEINIDGTVHSAIMKEVQFHPVKEEILHIDFLEINEEKPITVEIPVVLDGLAEGVKAGGKLNLQMRKLKVKGLYTNVPERLHIDVTNLGLGKTIQVRALSFENLEIKNAKDAVVCAVQLTRAARGAQAAANK